MQNAYLQRRAEVRERVVTFSLLLMAALGGAAWALLYVTEGMHPDGRRNLPAEAAAAGLMLGAAVVAVLLAAWVGRRAWDDRQYKLGRYAVGRACRPTNREMTRLLTGAYPNMDRREARPSRRSAHPSDVEARERSRRAYQGVRGQAGKSRAGLLLVLLLLTLLVIWMGPAGRRRLWQGVRGAVVWSGAGVTGTASR